jgi:hypothetical protein
VVTLKRLERQLLLGLDTHFSKLGDFGGENCFGGGCAVNAVGLDGDDDTAANLEEETGCRHVSIDMWICKCDGRTIETNDTGLIRLRNVGKNAVDHADQHAVLQWIFEELALPRYMCGLALLTTGILDDGDDVCAMCGHVDCATSVSVSGFRGMAARTKITARAVGELDGEDSALRANDIRDVRNGCTRCSTEVQHFRARSHVDVFDTAQDASC